jgi:cysteine protease ATG4
VRLGFETIGEEYFSSLLSCTKIPQFMGILGGKPRKAFFFVGAHHKSQQLIFLDPHMVQTHVSDLNGANKHYYLSNKHKYHSIDSSARMVHLSKLDPCMSLAYLV